MRLVIKPLVLVLLVEDELVEAKLVVVALVLFRLVIVPEATVRSVMVVVASVETPKAVNVPLEVRDEVAVIAPPVRVFMVPVTTERILEKKLVVVACPTVSLEMVVVPRLVLDPSTAKLPVEVAFPLTSTVNLLFSVHPEPFQ